MITCDKERLNYKIQEFSKYGSSENGGITRLSLSVEDLEARDAFCRKCLSMGMEIRTDDLANIYATMPGSEDLPAIMIGSHLDSVIKGGNYDGVLGVLAALEAVETIYKEKIKHRHPITIVVWTNEEGVRFEPAMMASGVICEKFNLSTMLAVKDCDGITFEEALDRSGYRGKIENRLNAVTGQAALVELHIEQGPVLEKEKKEIGIVEGVVGMLNYEFSFIGQADHAGATPMNQRKDALAAAVEVIHYLKFQLSKLDENLVYTIGRFLVSPNVHTVIPDQVHFTLDARHRDAKVLAKAVNIINRTPEKINKCKVYIRELWSRKTVEFNKELVNYVERSARDFGYSTLRMFSGPGHDAQYISEILPTAMIFVPSKNGLSHCENEFTALDNCWMGANVLLQTVLKIDSKLV